ncbi:hypothetical protein NLJ89_g2048 [Agrocybe chaxingu]|uniref:Uncharacterized protein n=1 Tax=Agrocybe chaxingu TaxID=84603 RepID=A0A9W8K7C1_9AGAR|nr:hypothetical protein NLJ89_g2048 [Agrocybe chaxingu]
MADPSYYASNAPADFIMLSDIPATLDEQNVHSEIEDYKYPQLERKATFSQRRSLLGDALLNLPVWVDVDFVPASLLTRLWLEKFGIFGAAEDPILSFGATVGVFFPRSTAVAFLRFGGTVVPLPFATVDEALLCRPMEALGTLRAESTGTRGIVLIGPRVDFAGVPGALECTV